MKPRIQYAQTSDGVNLAYWTLGEGSPPLIHLSLNAFGHIQREWEIPECRVWCERLARGRMLVRYDSRGQGLSDRDVADYSGEAFLRDLRAILRRLGFDRCALLGLQHSGPIAMAYAATFPDQVSHLILWCTWARGSDAVSQQLHGLGRLMDTNWQLYSEAVAHSLLGWSEGEKAHEYAGVVRASITQDKLKAFMRATMESDVTPFLSRINARTLVLHRRGVPLPDPSVASKLAAQIPGAELVLLDGTAVLPWLGDTASAVAVIQEFLGGVVSPDQPSQSPAGTAVILFADIAESTALTERLGDAPFREKARELDSALRTAISSNGGTAIEGQVLGDGVLATFGAAREAIACAAACHAAAGASGLQLHVGVHAGDVIREENNVFGGAVNIAARVAGEAAAGETLVSQTVRDLARTSAGVSFEDRGERELKGVRELVRLFAVRGQS